MDEHMNMGISNLGDLQVPDVSPINSPITEQENRIHHKRVTSYSCAMDKKQQLHMSPLNKSDKASLPANHTLLNHQMAAITNSHQHQSRKQPFFDNEKEKSKWAKANL
jgi:hypothetical protein